MFVRIKEWCFNIAMMGGIGAWYGGGFVASLVAFPVLFFFKMVSALHQGVYPLLCIAFMFLIILVIHGALHFQTDKDASYIIIDRILGLFVAFLGISLNLKFFIVGFLLFHFIGIFRPFIFNRIGSIDLRTLPGFLGIVVGDLIAGVSVNFFFRIVLWLAP